VRNKDYIAPEQLVLGQELEDLLAPKNGRLLLQGGGGDDPSILGFAPEVAEFYASNKEKINRQCDIYAVGAILYRLLLGEPPGPEIADFIQKKRLNEKSPQSNVYEVPYFFKDYILSNEMCFIIVRLLHQSPKHRYSSLAQVKEDLLNLRENIY
jgi:serine/threonine protein kinase